MADVEDPRDLDFPPRWRNWRYSGRAEYLTVNLSRADLFRAIVLEIEPHDLAPEDVAARSRFRKHHLAYIALRLGLFRP